MTEMAVRNTDLGHQRGVQDLVAAIELISSVEQAADATAVIRGLDAYARAQKSLELVNQAIELRIWAERKGGEAIITNRHKMKTLKEKHGIDAPTATRWVFLYLLDESFIKTYVDEVTRDGRQLNIKSLVSAGRDATRKRVAPGVFKNLNGTYTIEWKENGHKRVANGFRNKDEAIKRREQNVRLAPSKEASLRRLNAHADLSKLYGHVRRTLQAAGEVSSVSLDSEVMSALYTAEDIISRQMRESLASTGHGADK